MGRFNGWTERIRSSLFYVPMLFVVGGVVFGQVSVIVDSNLDQGATQLPLGLTSTVESARTVLGTIAGATITVAGIAFSVSLLIIQLASSQYSPRVIHGLFRDPFNKRVMGVVVGTFTYCLIVLRSVRAPLEEGGAPVIPNLSVAIAVLLGIVAILSIIGFINHSAHSMDVSQILQTVTDDALAQLDRVWTLESNEDQGDTGRTEPPDEPGFRVSIDDNGWVQHVDRERLVAALPAGSTARLDVGVGHYAIRGTALCTVWPEPSGEDVRDMLTAEARASVSIGTTRTMAQDVSYGVRQLADVALKALSPGINDPTTAQDAIFHMTAVLAEMLRRNPPSHEVEGEDGRLLLFGTDDEHADVVAMAFDEIRVAAASQPRVSLYILQALWSLTDLLERSDLADRAAPLREQARLVLEGAQRADLLDHDREKICAAYERRFGTV